MQLIPVTIEKDGAVRVARGWARPRTARLAIVALAGDEPASNELAQLSVASGSLGFLAEEPDLYNDADIIPGRTNPGFSSGTSDVPTG